MRKGLIEGLNKLNIDYSSYQLDQIDMFYDYLVKKNEVMNLTRITDKREFYVKHVLDSLLVSSLIKLNDQLILDLGTGAGFPGIPVKIFYPNLEMVLMDSVNKKLLFINDVIEMLDIKKTCTIHGRAEELAHDPLYRERFDVVLSRAVADLTVLSELSIPFVKIDGYFVAYKSFDIQEEILKGSYAVHLTSGSKPEIHEVVIPDTDIRRNIVLIKKNKTTPKAYPRKPGIPSKKPLSTK